MTKIFVAIPTGGMVHAGYLLFFQNIRKIEKYADYEININVVTSARTPENRNKLIKKFLATDCNWFLHLDADNVPPQNLLDMIDNDVDICSAVYYVWMEKRLVPLAMTRRGKSNKYTQFSKDVPDNQYLIEVDGVGGGGLLIKREVLETIKPPWFKDVFNKEGDKRVLGNDFYFCQKAQSAGFKIWVDLRIFLKHYHEIEMNELHDWIRDSFVMKQWK